MKKRTLYSLLIFLPFLFEPLAQAQEDVRLKIKYSRISDRIDPPANNLVTLNEEIITLSGKNKIVSELKRSGLSGYYASSTYQEARLGEKGSWKVFNKNTIIKTTDYKTNIDKIILTLFGDKKCSIKVSRTLKKGYKYFELRRIDTKELAQWTNTRYSDESC